MEPQEFERAWWGDCLNTFGEEAKQLVYAPKMGLVNTPLLGKWPVYDLAGRSVLDIGGGPVSMLLKCVNRGRCRVIDPCYYPAWIGDRYFYANIAYERRNGEDFTQREKWLYDEAWIYNVLQHVEDPRKVIANAKYHARVIRIFEWLETPPSEGHPHTLHAHELNEWLGGVGEYGFVDEQGATGLAYWGVFT